MASEKKEKVPIKRKEKILKLDNRIPDIKTYRELCHWMADSIDLRYLDWPVYKSDVLGNDSTGGTNPVPYAGLCRAGLLTTNSQDGFSDEDETQNSYVDFLVEGEFTRDVLDELKKSEDIHIVLNRKFTWDDEMWSRDFKYNVTAEIIDDGSSRVFSSIRSCELECISEQDEILEGMKEWRSVNGNMFSDDVINNFVDSALSGITVILKKEGTYPYTAADEVAKILGIELENPRMGNKSKARLKTQVELSKKSTRAKSL